MKFRPKRNQPLWGTGLKTLFMGVFVSFFCFGSLSLSQEAFAEGIKMRIVLINPSATKTQTKDLKKYLPKEITLRHVQDAGELEIEYDQEEGRFYAFKKGVEIGPLETKAFELIMDDVWMITEETLQTLRKDTERVTEHLLDSIYFEQADLIAKSIYGRLDRIAKVQTDPTVSRQQHIADYRENLFVIEEIKSDMAKLEKILVAVGGPPNLELIEESDINLKSPSSKTTWIIIFIVLLFIGILTATFYFTWHQQATITENIFTREKDKSFSEFKSPSGEEPKNE